MFAVEREEYVGESDVDDASYYEGEDEGLGELNNFTLRYELYSLL